MTMIERAARAMHNVAAPSVAWDNLSENSRRRIMAIACAAIAAMREPTDAMVTGASDNIRIFNTGAQTAALAWRAMIDAALAESGLE